jgi:deoxyribonuclease IV
MLPRLGAHTSTAGGLHNALTRGAELGCEIVQVFTKSNQQWAAAKISDEAVELWNAERARTGVEPAMAHAAYLINLGAPGDLLWERSLNALIEEYARCIRLGIRYLVLHPGAHMDAGEAHGIARVAAAIDRLHDAQPPGVTMLLLESTAGQGTCLGHRFEHMRDIFASVRDPERVAVCLDTCHLLAAGYDFIGDYDGVMNELDRVVGRDVVRAVHLNDSKRELGARVDRHEHIGRGAIGLEPFRRLLADPRFAGLPMALETPKPTDHSDPINLGILRSLRGKRRVGPRARALATQSLKRPAR